MRHTTKLRLKTAEEEEVKLKEPRVLWISVLVCFYYLNEPSKPWSRVPMNNVIGSQVVVVLVATLLLLLQLFPSRQMKRTRRVIENPDIHSAPMMIIAGNPERHDATLLFHRGGGRDWIKRNLSTILMVIAFVGSSEFIDSRSVRFCFSSDEGNLFDEFKEGERSHLRIISTKARITVHNWKKQIKK